MSRLLGRSGVVSLSAGLLLSMLQVLPGAAAVTGTITTIAGTGVRGYTGDGGPAVSAQLDHPRGLAVMADGSLLIAEPFKNVVRRIAPNGVISTVAGTGVAGFSGDGGPATAAQLNFVHAVSVTPDGGFVLADTLNNRIRKVGPDGIIRTITGTGRAGAAGDGGAATAARVNNPRGVASVSDGSVLVADSNNHRIRRISPTGIMSTVAGTGVQGFSGDGGAATLAQLNVPFGVAPIAGGGYLIDDVNNQRVRKVSSTGVITTVAGNGVAGYTGDGGPATSAALNAPHNVTVEADGSFLIADASNNVIREVSAGGVISTVAGTGVKGYSGDGGAATSAMLAAPKAIAVLGSTIVIADAVNARLRQVGGSAPPPPPPTAPSATSAPTVSGTAQSGATLTTSNGTWSGTTPITYTYRWQGCNGSDTTGSTCTDITGATSTTYAVTAVDVGRKLRSVVTATNSVGSSSSPSALTAVVVAPGAYRDVVLGDSPSTYLRLGEPAGSRTFGSEVGSASATAVGSGITAGATALISDADTAVKLTGGTGANGYLDVPYSSALNPPVFTAEAWVRVDARTGSSQVAFGSYHSATPGAGGLATDSFGFNVQPSTTWQLRIGGGVDTGFQRADSGVTVVLGQTYHLVVTYSATGVAALFVDGVPTVTRTVPYAPATFGPLRIGAGNSGDPTTTPKFQSPETVDELAIYPQVLTAAQITAHHDAGR